MVISVIYFLILLTYLALQLYLWWKWGIEPHPYQEADEYPAVTILVPVRDEEKSLGACLKSLQNQKYSDHLQIIVIDDHSSDQTANVARRFPEVKVINLSDGISGKKNAIREGIKWATGVVALTIDGDCEVGEEWVSVMVGSVKDDDNLLVTGPVWMAPRGPGFLQKYQEMEQAALNVLTCSGLKSGCVLSASGANMAYSKSLFTSLNPYDDNLDHPSGDDVFFVQKLHQRGGKIQFVRDRKAFVFTNPVTGLSEFIRQRLRWSTKSVRYTHWPTKLYLAVFAAVNWSFIVLLMAGLWHPIYYSYMFYGLLMKFIVDYLIIHTGMKWGHRPVCWQDVLKSSLFQVVYVVAVTVLALVGKRDRWKASNKI